MRIEIFRGLWYPPNPRLTQDIQYMLADEASKKAMDFVNNTQTEKPPSGFARQVNLQTMSDAEGITFIVTVNDINLTAAALMAPPGKVRA